VKQRNRLGIACVRTGKDCSRLLSASIKLVRLAIQSRDCTQVCLVCIEGEKQGEKGYLPLVVGVQVRSKLNIICITFGRVVGCYLFELHNK
jgi:hypothetical protein